MSESTTPPPAAAAGPTTDDRWTPRAPRPSRPPFARSSRDRIFGGIAGAIADRIDVEPVPVRIVLVALAIAGGGLVIPAYLLTWVTVARDDDPAPRVYEHVAIREGGIVMWVLAVILGVAVIGGVTDPFGGPSSSFPLLPLVLIGIGVALWSRGERRDAGAQPRFRHTAPPPPPGDAGAPTQTTGAPNAPTTGAGWRSTQENRVPTDVTTPMTPAGTDWPPTSSPPGDPRPARPPAPPRERSVLGPVTIAVALIAAGVAAALDASASLAIDLGATGVMTVALLVLGLGLLVGSVWGRARWLFLVALLLMPFIGLGVLVREVDENVGVDLAVSSGVGERRFVLVGDEPLPTEIDLLAGSVQLDLTAWEPDAAQLAALDGDGPDLTIGVGAGEVILELPTDVAWRVESDIALGQFDVRGPDGSFTREVDDFSGASRGDDSSRFVREGGAATGPVLDVTIDVALGQIQLQEPGVVAPELDDDDPTTDDLTTDDPTTEELS